MLPDGPRVQVASSLRSNMMSLQLPSCLSALTTAEVQLLQAEPWRAGSQEGSCQGQDVGAGLHDGVRPGPARPELRLGFMPAPIRLGIVDA